MLSGYLISQTLRRRMAEPGSTFLDFAIDRWSRIYSGFLLAILVVCLLDYCASSYSGISPETVSRLTWRGFFENLFMLQAPSVALPFGSAAPFWTVAIEFWIYMFVGLVAFSIRDGFSSIRVVLIAITGIIPLQSLAQNNMVTIPWFLGAALEMALYGRKIDSGRSVLVALFSAFSAFVYLRIRHSENIYNIFNFVLCAGVFQLSRC
jgi:peptidoglycan/LPS O-acetylase OafA/YrhL